MTPSQAEPQPATPETWESLGKLIDLHLLDPCLSSDQVYAACEFARDNGLRAVVVRPCDTAQVKTWLGGSDVIVASVAGYPDGTSTTGSKLFEGRDLLRLGAKELEFVLNPAAMISRQFQHVETELLQISRSCHESGARLTVVYNTRWLSEDLKIIATKICRRVETDTISIDGSEADLTLLKPLLRDVLRLKLAAPVQSVAEALAAREAGYASFAAVNVPEIVSGWKSLFTPTSPAPAVS